MGKRRRNTAKTGDKAVYKRGGQAGAFRDDKSDHADDDAMLDKVDRFHEQREQDFLRLDNSGANEDSDNDEATPAILDLGLGGDSSDDASSSTSSQSDEDEAKPTATNDDSSSNNDNHDAGFSSDDDNDEFDNNDDDVRDWGRKKSLYYHGDTADLEIGQDQEDAFAEETAAQQVQAARYAAMTDDDFALDDEDNNATRPPSAKITAGASFPVQRDVRKLSASEQERLVERHHPEMLPLLAHFGSMVTELENNTMTAYTALFDGTKTTAQSVGATKLGQQYLVTKAILQSSIALHMTAYLLLKAEHAVAEDVDVEALMQSHPVMASLQKLHGLSQKLNAIEDSVPGLATQLTNLVAAAELVNGGEDASEDNLSVNCDDDVVAGMEESDESGHVVENGRSAELSRNAASDMPAGATKNAAELDEVKMKRALDDARFGVRLDEIVESHSIQSRSRRRMVPLPFGDEDDADDRSRNAVALASTLNRIAQKVGNQQRKRIHVADELDDVDDEHEKVESAIDMMQAALGPPESDNGDDDTSVHLHDAKKDSDGFYERAADQAKSKKADKKAKYAVAPKFPRVDALIDGERPISRTILKNRGLVAHKNKLNRNPRVKKREQYRKALIRRRGAVREVRDGGGQQYGGEETGIKAHLSRSRKIGS